MSTPTPANCSGLANSGVPAKAPGRVGGGLRQPKVNDFSCYSAPLLDTHHDVTRFDVPMDELLLVHRNQTGSNLRRDFQRHLHLKPAGTVVPFHKRLRTFILARQITFRNKIPMTG
jgi:hypothetical protein